MKTTSSKQHSYIMPAEWETHAATWLAWPHYQGDWPGKFPTVKWCFLEMIRHITDSETLRLLVKNKKVEDEVKSLCDLIHLDHHKIEFFHIPTNRGWMRDCGPTFVRDKNNKDKILLDFKFSGWAKYSNHKLDNKVPQIIQQQLISRTAAISSQPHVILSAAKDLHDRETSKQTSHDLYPLIQPRHKGKPVVLEGGSIDVNGEGLLLTTEECLQSPIQERNPGFTKDDYAEIFQKYLGITEVIWLKNGIAGDDTHGHVDDIARFAPNNVVVVASEKNKNDANHAALAENIHILKQYKQLQIVELPMPQQIRYEGYPLPASYANFLITNRKIITPTFNDVNDRIALNILAEVFPKHEVVGINCTDLVLGLGTIHCLTQQEPV